MPRVESQKGPDFTIHINGEIFGVSSEVRWRTSTGAKAIRGIDVMIPQEIAPTIAHISGSMNCYRLQDSAGIEGAGIAPVEAHMSRTRYFSIQVTNRVTDTVILSIPKAMCGEQEWTLIANRLLAGSFTFEGIGWSNEF